MAKPTRRTVSIVNNAVARTNSALFGLSGDFPELAEIEVAMIDPNPAQPRKYFDEAEIAALAESIAAKGLLQPILVRPDADIPGRYLLIAGERRLRAHRLLGRDTIFAIVKTGDDDAMALIENIQRVDLNPFELADGLAALAGQHDYSQRDLAAIIGRSQTEIARTLGLRRLAASIRADYMADPGRVSKSALLELTGIEDEAEQLRLWQAVKGGLGVTGLRAAKKEGPPPEGADRPAAAAPQRLLKTIERGVQGLRQAPLDDGARQRLRSLRDMIDDLLAED